MKLNILKRRHDNGRILCCERKKKGKNVPVVAVVDTAFVVVVDTVAENNSSSRLLLVRIYSIGFFSSNNEGPQAAYEILGILSQRSSWLDPITLDCFCWRR